MASLHGGFAGKEWGQCGSEAAMSCGGTHGRDARLAFRDIAARLLQARFTRFFETLL